MQLADREYVLTVSWRDRRGYFSKDLTGSKEYILRNIGYLALKGWLNWCDITAIQAVVKEMPLGTRVVNCLRVDLELLDRLANPKQLRYERKQYRRAG